MKHHSLFIAITGGSGSGKTLLSRKLQESFQPRTSLVIAQDSYYKSLPEQWIGRASDYNFDHPDAIDWDLLVQQLQELKKGHGITFPLYDFVTHTRSGFAKVGPAEILIYEGITILGDLSLAAQMHLKIYLDIPADIRLLRRIERDVKERGRSIDSVLHQYQTTVRPMHLEFVGPSQVRADIILPDAPVEEWVAKILACLPEKMKPGNP
jgi:uridine kinase